MNADIVNIYHIYVKIYHKRCKLNHSISLCLTANNSVCIYLFNITFCKWQEIRIKDSVSGFWWFPLKCLFVELNPSDLHSEETLLLCVVFNNTHKTILCLCNPSPYLKPCVWLHLILILWELAHSTVRKPTQTPSFQNLGPKYLSAS